MDLIVRCGYALVRRRGSIMKFPQVHPKHLHSETRPPFDKLAAKTHLHTRDPLSCSGSDAQPLQQGKCKATNTSLPRNGLIGYCTCLIEHLTNLTVPLP